MIKKKKLTTIWSDTVKFEIKLDFNLIELNQIKLKWFYENSIIIYNIYFTLYNYNDLIYNLQLFFILLL